MTTTHEDYEERARQLGFDAGQAAGTWVFDGNTDTRTYAKMLEGIEEGDPEILDKLPNMAPLSGEWADGPTPASLLSELGLNPDEPEEWFDGLLDAYEVGYHDGVVFEVTATARHHLGLD